MVGMSVSHCILRIFWMERSFPILTPASHGKEVGLALWSRGTRTVPGDSLDRIPPSLGHHLLFLLSAAIRPDRHWSTSCLTVIAGVEKLSRKSASQDYSKHRSKVMQNTTRDKMSEFEIKTGSVTALCPARLEPKAKGKKSILILTLFKNVEFVTVDFVALIFT